MTSSLGVLVGDSFEDLAMNALEAAAIEARIVAVEAHGLSGCLFDACDKPSTGVKIEHLKDRARKTYHSAHRMYVRIEEFENFRKKECDDE